ncbi:MAG: phosphoglycerate kinase [Patescibacteria group bacterium]|nr:phosphoglycerate kinase [Patescibacteria group bacterium]
MKKTLRDIDLAGKKVIHHCDFNIKLKKNECGEMSPISDVRIKAYFPSIFYLLEKKCKIIFISYLERPGGKVVKKLSLAPIAKRLSHLINREVKHLPDLVGPKVRDYISKMNSGEMVMLENTRFYPGEEADDNDFAKELAKNGDVMVMDGFGHTHRIHASVTGIPRHIPAVAGMYLESEMQVFDKLKANPKRPLVLIVGGTKVYDKIKAIRHLINKADYVLIGGAVANNFLKAKGVEIGESFLEEPFVDKAKKVKIGPVEEAKKLMNEYGDKIVIPEDLIAGNKVKNPNKRKLIDLENGDIISEDWVYLDIGPKTIDKFLSIIKKAKTVFWDGPMGKYENTRFRGGTLKIAEAIAQYPEVSILAGGDTAALAENFGLIFRYSHVSIAGGATLQYIADRAMPGIDALLDK